MTANGKRSESENDGHGHESCPTESELYNPSLLLDPRIGKHGRIEQWSGPPEPLSIHHVAERAVMNGGEATKEAARAGGVRCERATSPSPAPEGAEETEACSHATEKCSETFPPPPPSRSTEVEREWRKPPGTQHQVHPENPPSYPAHLKGGKNQRRKSQAAELPKKFLRGARPPGQGEQSLKGVIFYVPCRSSFLQKVPTAPESNQHKSHKSCLLYISYPYT